ncbi:hypothetical protein ACER0C_002493 [Sarotherodon galilaeus]
MNAGLSSPSISVSSASGHSQVLKIPAVSRDMEPCSRQAGRESVSGSAQTWREEQRDKEEVIARWGRVKAQWRGSGGRLRCYLYSQCGTRVDNSS